MVGSQRGARRRADSCTAMAKLGGGSSGDGLKKGKTGTRQNSGRSKKMEMPAPMLGGCVCLSGADGHR